MKNYIKTLLLTICIGIISMPVFATEGLTFKDGFGLYDPIIANSVIVPSISVQLNGEFIDFTDSEGNKVEPQIINDRTMVPMRKIFEVLGAEVEWNGEDKSIEATKGDVKINLQIGNKNANLTTSGDETKEIILDAEPVIIENRTMVPVRFIAESLEKVVGWDSFHRAVIIIDMDTIKEKIKNEAPTFYEYLTLELEDVSTANYKTEVTGKLKYTDKENKKNNSTINIVGDGNIKMSKEAMQFDMSLRTTGSGILIDTIKEEKLTKITANIIFDKENGCLYIASNLLGEDAEDKYLRYSLEENSRQLLSDGTDISSMLDSMITEDNLTINSYETMLEAVEMITTLMSDKNFTCSGRNTKTFELKVDLSDILESLGETPNEETSDEVINCEIISRVKVSEKLIKETSTEIDFTEKNDDEQLNIEVKIENTLKEHDKKVSIKVPNDKDILPEV